ncbi:expressed unknown protein [Ectocarpus siliculosus]|uniref:Uncharacterized protein n=1 Tax=Ectocarpus siliculosus TaxID=2880 RepID=D7FVL4_ECTSI|nr:expressed unknown protein [Ectocarpus siliculosus]|eukprot:CBJ31935.1 expressed unknown protein [Ectocarpus siliculosus]
MFVGRQPLTGRRRFSPSHPSSHNGNGTTPFWASDQNWEELSRRELERLSR